VDKVLCPLKPKFLDQYVQTQYFQLLISAKKADFYHLIWVKIGIRYRKQVGISQSAPKNRQNRLSDDLLCGRCDGVQAYLSGGMRRRVCSNGVCRAAV